MTALAPEAQVAPVAVPRSIWNGYIQFGLVNVPIRLHVAQQAQEISFRSLHRECGTPVQQKRWCPTHDRELEQNEIVKGWEISKGAFVTIEDSELEPLESQGIELLRFVSVDDVPPLWLGRTYYLAPADDGPGRRAYDLLLRACEAEAMAGLGRVVMFRKEHLCLIRPLEGLLCLTLLFLPEDIRSPVEIRKAVDRSERSDQELELARELIRQRAGKLNLRKPAKLFYRESLKALLAAKVAGGEPNIVRPPESSATTIDLTEALRRSVRKRKATKGR